MVFRSWIGAQLGRSAARIIEQVHRGADRCPRLEVKSLSVVYRGSVTGDPDQALMAWMVGSSVSSFAGSVAARDRVMTSMPR